MENYSIITSSKKINEIFDTAQEKLVVLLFYTKNNPECRHAKNSFEKSASNHSVSIFCLVDMDKFEGESRYINKVTQMPRIDCYYISNLIGTVNAYTENDVEQCVKTGERYVMTQNNSKMNPVQQNTQYDQVRQQILMANPQHYAYFMQNPVILNNMVQQYMQQRQQQQQPQPQMMSQVATAMADPNNPALGVLPTITQMQQLFQIFLMMQKLGMLQIPEKNIPDPREEATILPNGDKIVPLANGKFGLIKKK